MDYQSWWHFTAHYTLWQQGLELAKGKHAVEIASESELVSTLEQIRAAVEQGELDEPIEAQAAWRNRVNTIKAEKPKIEFAD